MPWEREQIGACTLYRGDCREILPTLGQVDAVVTDPPYGVELMGKRALSRPGRKRVQTLRAGTYTHADTTAYIVEVVVPIISQCRRLAPVVVITPGVRQMWNYPVPNDVGGFLRPGSTGIGPWGFTCYHPILYYGTDPYLRAGMGSRPNSTSKGWPNDANMVAHPCAKPLDMQRWLVERASLPGHIVCDPFMGSGTTGVACVQLGRPFLGIEIERRYFDLACRRIEQAYQQLDLFPPHPPAPRPTQLALVREGG